MRVGNGRVTKQMLDEWVQEFFKFCEDGPLLTYSYHLYICKRAWHVTGVQYSCSQCEVDRQNGLEGSGQERLKAVLVICEEGGGQLRAWTDKGSTSVLHLFHHFAVGIFYLLWVSDIHLEHREALGADSSQVLCSGSLFIQNSHKYREAKFIQVFGQSMAKSGIATCKGLRQYRVGSRPSGRRNYLIIHCILHMIDSPCFLERVGLEEVSLPPMWENGQRSQNRHISLYKKKKSEVESGVGHKWKGNCWWRDGLGVVVGQRTKEEGEL